MPLDGDRFFLANLAVINIQHFAASLGNMTKEQIRGLNRFVNDVKNGKKLGDSLDKFYSNVLRAVSSITVDDCPDIGVRTAETLGRSIQKMREYSSMIVTDNPIEYHAKRLITPDINEIARFFTDVTSSFRRIFELMKLENKALSLPALKDQYNLAFERLFKPLKVTVSKLLDDGVISKGLLNERAEDILCLNWCIGNLKETKSDARMIRNLFAHPDRIDRYDHYQLILDNGVLDLYPDDLMTLNTCLINKLSLFTFMCNVVLTLEMYHRVFEA